MVSEGSSTHPLQGLDVFCGPGLVLQTTLATSIGMVLLCVDVVH